MNSPYRIFFLFMVHFILESLISKKFQMALSFCNHKSDLKQVKAKT